MGARNVAGVFVKWGHLPPTSKILLIYMAHVAHDGPEPTFWGGREALAGALGRTVPSAPERGDYSPAAEAARAVRAAAFQAVKDALRPLIVAGAARRSVVGANGRRTEYRLNLDPFAKGEEIPTPKGEEIPTPKEQQRNNRGLPRGRTSPDPSTHLPERPAGQEAMSEGGSSAGAALAAMAASGVFEALPPWCGHCTEASRTLTPTGPGPHRPRRCPDCHPLAVTR